MIKTTRFYFTFLLLLVSLTALSQVSELNLSGLNNCIPSKNSEVISSVEQSYKNGVLLYNDGINSSISEQIRLEKLISLFKIQIIVKDKLNEIWQQSDSLSKDISKKYFEELQNRLKD